MIGSVEAIEVLMSFHQSQMTRQVLFLPTEIKPRQRMLKSKRDLQQLQDDSSDIYMSTRFDEYLHRPEHLKDMTYVHRLFSTMWNIPNLVRNVSKNTLNSSSGGVKAVQMKIRRAKHNQKREISHIYGLEPPMMILQSLY